MSKVVKIAAVVAGIALAIPTGGGSLLAVGLGVSAAAASAIVVGLTVASSLLAKKSKAPSTSDNAADRLTVSIDPRTPRKFVFGRTAMATDLRDHEIIGSDQDYVDRFIVVASHAVQSIEEIWFDDKLAWSSAGGVQGEFAGYLTVQTRLEGNAGNAINISARMGSTRRYTGLAYVYFRYKLSGNTKKTTSPFQQSIPARVTIIGRAAKVYDPRLDDTVPGGSGSMRADDQSTWAWNDSASRNPALQLLWYLLGWRINGELAVGKGIPPARINLESFITAANLCDESVALAAGGTEPRYRSDGVFSEGDATSTVIDQFKATMNAELDDVDGRLRLLVLHNDLATPIADFSEDDVLDDFTWDPAASLDDTFNVVRGTYIDPSTTSLYQAVDYPEVRIASPDDIDRIETVDLQLVQSPSQAQRLGKQRVARMLYSGTFTATLGHRAWKVQRGDVVRLSFAPLGWTNKLFRVVDTSVEVDGTVPMILREESADIYLWDKNEAPAVAPVLPTSYDPAKDPLYTYVVNNAGAGAFTMVPGANVETTPNSITRVSGVGAWDAGAYSLEGYQGDVQVTAQVASLGRGLMIALNSDPAADDDYVGLDFALYQRGDNSYQIFESGSSVGSPFGTVVIGDIVMVRRRGSNIEYSVNGAAPIVRAGVTSPTTRLFMDSVLYSLDAQWKSITFGPVGSDGAPGLDGDDGLPGAPGVDGQTSYVHFAYANAADGSVDFTTGAAGGRYYVGVYTDFTVADSTNPASYAWSLQRGADGENGTPGAPGPDGAATYVHIAYATSADGSTGFSTTDGAGKTYIGTYTDGTLADSTNPALYTWSLIKGADGSDGSDGVSALTITTRPVAISVPCTANGTPKGSIPGFSIKVSQEATDVTASATYGAPSSSGMTGTIVVSSGGVVSGITNMTGDDGYIEVAISYGGASGVARVGYTKIEDALAYANDEDTTISNPGGSYAEAARCTLLVGPNGSFACSYNVTGTPVSNAAAIDGYLEFSLNGSSWSAVSGFSSASVSNASDGSLPPGEPTGAYGTASFTGSSAGLSAKQTAYVRLMLRKTGLGTITGTTGSLLTQWGG